jgi:3-isopropylmalate/(R)-2-methylmalate dehydratase small subunit
MEPIQNFSSRLAPLPINDIDTDQIIPARYLKVTDKAGLGEACFADWRYESDGTPKADFFLNNPQYNGAGILVGGNNFGCGSSREHAPWALLGAGFKAIVSTDFADIFRNNSLKNGLLPIMVDEETHRQLVSLVEEDPSTAVAIDLERQTLTLPDGRAVEFPIDPFSKYCLLNGFDQLGFLINQEEAIVEFERAHPTSVKTTA